MKEELILTINKMKKVAENEIYKAYLEYYKLIENNSIESTTAIQMNGKLTGLRKMAWMLELIDTAKVVEIENKAKKDIQQQ